MVSLALKSRWVLGAPLPPKRELSHPPPPLLLLALLVMLALVVVLLLAAVATAAAAIRGEGERGNGGIFFFALVADLFVCGRNEAEERGRL